MVAVVSVVFQVKLVAPLAVKVAVCPIQIDGELMLIVGVGVMLTVDVVVFVQTPLLPVTT